MDDGQQQRNLSLLSRELCYWVVVPKARIQRYTQALTNTSESRKAQQEALSRPQQIPQQARHILPRASSTFVTGQPTQSSPTAFRLFPFITRRASRGFTSQYQERATAGSSCTTERGGAGMTVHSTSKHMKVSNSKGDHGEQAIASRVR